MKIKDLGLLDKYYPGGSFSGMDNIGIISWGDWVLEKIEGGKLFLKAREGIRGGARDQKLIFERKNITS